MESLCHSEKRTKESWLAHELAQLKRMYEAGEPIPKIAAALDKPQIKVIEMRQRARLYRSPESAQAHANSASWIRIRRTLEHTTGMTTKQLHLVTKLSISAIRREINTHRGELRIVEMIRTPGRSMAVYALIENPCSTTV